MNSIKEFISEIKKRRKCLQNLLEKPDDLNYVRKISFSLVVYTEIEYIFAPLLESSSDDSKLITDDQIFIERILPYLKKMQLSSDYLFQKLDFDYVNELLTILAKAYSFSILPVYVDNDQIVDLTKDFYRTCCPKEISEHALALIDSFSTLFLDENSRCLSVVGRSYIDAYYGDAYSLIQKAGNIQDYCGLSHEIFHGVHSKLNPDVVFNSIDETKEAGAVSIEFMFFAFLVSHGIVEGETLKKLSLLSISNEAYVLNKNIETSFFTVDFVNSFLLLEAKIVGYGLAQNYSLDTSKSKDKIRDYIYHNFDRSNLPDYSFLGYSKEEILATAKKLVQERDILISSNHQKSL